MAVRPATDLAAFELRPWVADRAPLVAGWLATDDDLFHLAPATLPPLTAPKVLAWTDERDHPYLFWRRDGTSPVGYGELNHMSRDRCEMWIGHLIVPELLRGQGIGYAFVRHLLQAAFGDFAARHVSLVVFPDNQPAVHCYLKAGLCKEGTQTKTFDHRPGKHLLLRMGISLKQYERLKIRDHSAR